MLAITCLHPLDLHQLQDKEPTFPTREPMAQSTPTDTLLVHHAALSSGGLCLLTISVVHRRRSVGVPPSSTGECAARAVA